MEKEKRRLVRHMLLGVRPVCRPKQDKAIPHNNYNNNKFIYFWHSWLIVCLTYIYEYLHRIISRFHLIEMDRMNKRGLEDETGCCGTSDCSFSSSRPESGYFSLGYSPLRDTSDENSFYQSPQNVAEEDKAIRHQSATGISHFEQPFNGNNVMDVCLFDHTNTILDYEDSAKLIVRNVAETKYVTAIFEANNGGIETLMTDVLTELKLWFEEETLVGIACEVHWSVPEQLRVRSVERRLKDGIHSALRGNNRHIMDLFNTPRSCPLTLEQSDTQQNSFSHARLRCFQGVYRRFYRCLLPYQHKETVKWHDQFWKLKEMDQMPEPNPAQFLSARGPGALTRTSLVALNLIALRLSPA